MVLTGNCLRTAQRWRRRLAERGCRGSWRSGTMAEPLAITRAHPTELKSSGLVLAEGRPGSRESCRALLTMRRTAGCFENVKIQSLRLPRGMTNQMTTKAAKSPIGIVALISLHRVQKRKAARQGGPSAPLPCDSSAPEGEGIRARVDEEYSDARPLRTYRRIANQSGPAVSEKLEGRTMDSPSYPRASGWSLRPRSGQ